MKRLWTPWRLDYILGEKATGCIFCEKARENRDRENYILYRGERGFIMLNLYPYNNGHLMVVPYAHVCGLEELDEATLAELMRLVKRGTAALQRAMNPEGFNIGMNIGKVAGAGIADHVHLHVVPRWAGDTNFIPVLSDTRLIPELPETTYERLIAAGIAAD
ncbi:MAG: HIT domain-containing protein [Chloroflexi bacterium]|nr:HIT domain-containing protein [Chloroflexota bacterium]MCL5074049.1 HIT domain-containing protein [Chloroflexota bacterium]